jgi:hypothetical protein
MSHEPKNFPTVQDALDFVATHLSMDEFMSRRGHNRKDIRFIIRVNRAQRLAWQHAADKRADKRNGEEEQ